MRKFTRVMFVFILSLLLACSHGETDNSNGLDNGNTNETGVQSPYSDMRCDFSGSSSFMKVSYTYNNLNPDTNVEKYAYKEKLDLFSMKILDAALYMPYTLAIVVDDNSDAIPKSDTYIRVFDSKTTIDNSVLSDYKNRFEESLVDQCTGDQNTRTTCADGFNVSSFSFDINTTTKLFGIIRDTNSTDAVLGAVGNVATVLSNISTQVLSTNLLSGGNPYLNLDVGAVISNSDVGLVVWRASTGTGDNNYHMYYAVYDGGWSVPSDVDDFIKNDGSSVVVGNHVQSYDIASNGRYAYLCWIDDDGVGDSYVLCSRFDFTSKSFDVPQSYTGSLYSSSNYKSNIRIAVSGDNRLLVTWQEGSYIYGTLIKNIFSSDGEAIVSAQKLSIDNITGTYPKPLLSDMLNKAWIIWDNTTEGNNIYMTTITGDTVHIPLMSEPIVSNCNSGTNMQNVAVNKYGDILVACRDTNVNTLKYRYYINGSWNIVKSKTFDHTVDSIKVASNSDDKFAVVVIGGLDSAVYQNLYDNTHNKEIIVSSCSMSK